LFETKENKENNSDRIDLFETKENKENNSDRIDLFETNAANINVNDNVNVNGNGNGNVTDNLKSEKNHSPPPPPQIINKIISESHSLGFIIDMEKAAEFYHSGVDPPMLESPYSFIAFAAERTKAQYPDKAQYEQQNLFNHAVITWENLRDEYPAWKKEREAERQKAEREEFVINARNNRPTKCRCGGELNGKLVCLKCGGAYDFDDQKCEYIFYQKSGLNLVKEFKDRIAGDGRRSENDRA
jgi:hypothetical protein